MEADELCSLASSAVVSLIMCPAWDRRLNYLPSRFSIIIPCFCCSFCQPSCLTFAPRGAAALRSDHITIYYREQRVVAGERHMPGDSPHHVNTLTYAHSHSHTRIRGDILIAGLATERMTVNTDSITVLARSQDTSP